MVCTIGAINMYVHFSDVYVHVYTFTYKFTDIVEQCTYSDISIRLQLLICLASWPVDLWGWLLPGVTPIQVQASNLIGISLRA